MRVRVRVRVRVRAEGEGDLWCAREVVAPILTEKPLHILHQVAAAHAKALDGAVQDTALEHRHCVGDAVAHIQRHAGGSAGGVERERGVDLYGHGGHLEGLEHHLGHLLAIGLRVEKNLGEQDSVLFKGDMEIFGVRNVFLEFCE